MKRISVLPHRCLAALGLFLVSVYPGCTQQSPKFAVADGKVAIGDSPVSGVVVTLQPIGSTTGRKASAPIFNGEFVFTEDSRLEGGRYRVRFSVMPEELLNGIPEPYRRGIPVSGQVVPLKFDTNSQITWELQAGGANSNAFQIEFESR
ncbi:MAG: hypothetical protein AAF745_16260 [Planctomycetota bacterium]